MYPCTLRFPLDSIGRVFHSVSPSIRSQIVALDDTTLMSCASDRSVGFWDISGEPFLLGSLQTSSLADAVRDVSFHGQDFLCTQGTKLGLGSVPARQTSSAAFAGLPSMFFSSPDPSDPLYGFGTAMPPATASSTGKMTLFSLRGLKRAATFTAMIQLPGVCQTLVLCTEDGRLVLAG